MNNKFTNVKLEVGGTNLIIYCLACEERVGISVPPPNESDLKCDLTFEKLILNDTDCICKGNVIIVNIPLPL